MAIRISFVRPTWTRIVKESHPNPTLIITYPKARWVGGLVSCSSSYSSSPQGLNGLIRLIYFLDKDWPNSNAVGQENSKDFLEAPQELFNAQSVELNNED